MGRVGHIAHHDKNPGSFDIVTITDSKGHQFATRLSNVFVIGAQKAAVTLPKGKGVRLTIAEERDRRLARA
jgi:small subunit ribosomal protein S4e